MSRPAATRSHPAGRRAAAPDELDDAASTAFDLLAPLYERFTAGHDVPAWTSQLEALARAAGLTGRRVLDVGCGTGASVAPMLARGYDVVGVDVSAGMLRVARERLGQAVRLERADMRALPTLGRFDLVWSLGDVVNWLRDDADLVAAFAGLARNLAADGVVVFDVETLASFRALYSSLIVVPAADRVLILDGRAPADLPPGATAHARIDCLEADAPPFWRRRQAVHRQRHQTRARLEAALAAAGLRCVAVWGTDGAGGSEQPLDELRHNKAVYIARHAARERQGRR
jgi:SAM-dependent methyltransferase